MEAARGCRKDGIQEKAPKDGIIQKEVAKAKDGTQGDTVPKEKGKECKEHATTVEKLVIRQDCVHSRQHGILVDIVPREKGKAKA